MGLGIPVHIFCIYRCLTKGEQGIQAEFKWISGPSDNVLVENSYTRAKTRLLTCGTRLRGFIMLALESLDGFCKKANLYPEFGVRLQRLSSPNDAYCTISPDVSTSRTGQQHRNVANDSAHRPTLAAPRLN